MLKVEVWVSSKFLGSGENGSDLYENHKENWSWLEVVWSSDLEGVSELVWQ